MKNLKISSKLTAAFGMINAIYILGVIALLLSYMMSNDRLNNMNNEAVTPQIIIGEVRDAILRERIAAMQLILLEPGSREYAAMTETREAEHRRSVAAISSYREASLDESGKNIANEIKSYYENEYSDFINGLVRLAEQGNAVAATNWIAASEEIEIIMDERLDSATGLVKDRIADFIYDARFGLIRLFIIAAAAIVLIIILIAYIIKYMQRAISRKIEKITYAANLLAVGNLDIDITSDSTDEIGRLAESFMLMAESIGEQAEVLSAIAEGDQTVYISPRSEQDTMNIAIEKMIDGLNSMFRKILYSTSQVSGGARQIADGAQLLAQGATEQAAAVEQVSISVAGVTGTTQENSAMAQKTAELMDAVNNNASSGSKQMNKMTQAVQEISAASQAISKVIKVIDDIAFQTNILALNAAVEASRAGNHGKGFAVVADEVRNLAAKSAEAAKETSALIENSIEKASLGADIAAEAVKSFELIVSGIDQSATLISDISRLSQQQGNVINQINQNIDKVSQVVQQNSATAEESAASSEELSSQSEVLEDLIFQFKVKQVNTMPSHNLLQETYDYL